MANNGEIPAILKQLDQCSLLLPLELNQVRRIIDYPNLLQVYLDKPPLRIISDKIASRAMKLSYPNTLKIANHLITQYLKGILLHSKRYPLPIGAKVDYNTAILAQAINSGNAASALPDFRWVNQPENDELEKAQKLAFLKSYHNLHRLRLKQEPDNSEQITWPNRYLKKEALTLLVKVEEQEFVLCFYNCTIQSQSSTILLSSTDFKLLVKLIQSSLHLPKIPLNVIYPGDSVKINTLRSSINDINNHLKKIGVRDKFKISSGQSDGGISVLSPTFNLSGKFPNKIIFSFQNSNFELDPLTLEVKYSEVATMNIRPDEIEALMLQYWTINQTESEQITAIRKHSRHSQPIKSLLHKLSILIKQAKSV